MSRSYARWGAAPSPGFERQSGLRLRAAWPRLPRVRRAKRKRFDEAAGGSTARLQQKDEP